MMLNDSANKVNDATNAVNATDNINILAEIASIDAENNNNAPTTPCIKLAIIRTAVIPVTSISKPFNNPVHGIAERTPNEIANKLSADDNKIIANANGIKVMVLIFSVLNNTIIPATAPRIAVIAMSAFPMLPQLIPDKAIMVKANSFIATPSKIIPVANTLSFSELNIPTTLTISAIITINV